MFLKRITWLLDNNVEIIYYDESLFRLNNEYYRSWESKLIEMPNEGQIDRDKSMLVLACSKDQIVYYDFHEDYIDSELHIKIIKRILKKLSTNEKDIPINDRKPKVLFLDNASSHVSKEAVEFYDEVGLSIITPPPYHSYYNMAEFVFRILKNAIYKTHAIDL